MSSLTAVYMGLVATAAHPLAVETTTSSLHAGTDAAVGLAMMLTGLSIFVCCLAVRRKWYHDVGYRH